MKSRNDFGPDEQGDKDYKKYLRTNFAAIAMQGLIAGADINMAGKDLAKQSVMCADALIAELDKTQST